MQIKANDILIPIMADDENVIAYKVTSPKKQDELIIPCMASDGLIAVKVASMKKQDDIGLEAIAVDGVTVALKGIEYGLGMVLVFIDESNTIYYPDGQANWDADVSAFNALVDVFGPPEAAMVCKVYLPDYDIVPTGRNTPSPSICSTICTGCISASTTVTARPISPARTPIMTAPRVSPTRPA